MTEEEAKYWDGEFKDGEMQCHADLADYRRMVEEFYLEWRDRGMDSRTRAIFEEYLSEEHNP